MNDRRSATESCARLKFNKEDRLLQSYILDMTLIVCESDSEDSVVTME